LDRRDASTRTRRRTHETVDRAAGYRDPRRCRLRPLAVAVVRGTAQCVGLSGDLPAPWSFITSNDLGVPILATRNAAGQPLRLRHRLQLEARDGHIWRDLHFSSLYKDTLLNSFHGNVQCYDDDADTGGHSHRMIMCHREFSDIRQIPRRLLAHHLRRSDGVLNLPQPLRSKSPHWTRCIAPPPPIDIDIGISATCSRPSRSA
jgi:hypothetical protein